MCAVQVYTLAQRTHLTGHIMQT